MKNEHKNLVDELFKESRPQVLFEGVWFESFYVTHLVWKMTLALHSTNSDETKAEFLSFLKKKSAEMFQMEEKLFETRREIADKYYKYLSEPHKKEWYEFYEEIKSFQDEIMQSLTRLLLFKSVLQQIDESHPKRSEIEKAYEFSFKKLKDAKKKNDLISPDETEVAQAVHDAIVITRAIADDVSFEEADKIERKRWA